jgi:GTP-binding protein
MKKINFLNSKFIGAYTDISEIPDFKLPEFMILGRSNVGKSSLINALTRKQIAKTSSTPGKTETINVYLIDDAFVIYDLPGYGYAKIKNKRAGFSEFIDDFIKSKGNQLKSFLLLIDSRHPLSPDDASMIDYLRHLQSPLSIIYTKVDKLNTSELKNCIISNSNQIKAIYIKAFEILPFSSKMAQHCKNLEKLMETWAK